MQTPPLLPAPRPVMATQQEVDPLRHAAQELETVFLSEMLKAAGLHKAPKLFGGGAGEDQFQSILIQSQAAHMVRSGGIGLAESLYNALKDRDDV